MYSILTHEQVIRTRVSDQRDAHVCVMGAWVKLGFGSRTNCLSRQNSHGSGALPEPPLPSFLSPTISCVASHGFHWDAVLRNERCTASRERTELRDDGYDGRSSHHGTCDLQHGRAHGEFRMDKAKSVCVCGAKKGLHH